MAFVKFENDQRTMPDFKITKIAIVISAKGWEKAGFVGTEYVNLYFDRQTSRIGISATDAEDPNRFPAKQTSRGISIPAKKFFTKFGISSSEVTGEMLDTGTVVAFKVKMPDAEPALTLEGNPVRRRGRPPKAA